MGDQNLTPHPVPFRREGYARSLDPRREPGRRALSSDAQAYLDAVLPRLEAERYEVTWDQFNCVATLSRYEWSKFGFVDYTFVFVEFDVLDALSLWTFSRTAFDYAAARGGMSMPGLQGAKVCLPVAVIASDEGAVAAVRDTAAPKHYAKMEFPCVFDLRARKLHFFQGTPLWGAFYYAGLRELAARMLSPDRVTQYHCG